MKQKICNYILYCLKNIAIHSTEYASIFGMGQPKEPEILRKLKSENDGMG